MNATFKQLAILLLCFGFISIKAQKEELACKKFEEGLYLSSFLNKPLSPQRFIDSITGCMSESPKLHLTVGKYLYRNDDYSAAENEYHKIVNGKSANKKEIAEAYYYLSLCAYHTAMYEQSVALSLKALEYGYYAVWVNENIGLALSNNGQQEAAIQYYQKALEADPNYASAANNIGVSYHRMKKPESALTYYYIADSLAHGNNAIYPSNIFRVLRKLNRKEEAVALIKKVYPKFKDHKLIIADYTQVLEDEKNYAELLKSARRLFNMHPSTSNEWFDVGYAYFEGGQVDTAFYAYNIAIKYDPKNIEAYSNLILIYNELGMYKESNAKLDIGFSLDSNYWYFYERKYSINIWQHNFDEAYKWAMRLQTRFGTKEKTFDFDLGWAALHQKNYTEAIDHFRIELSKKPQDDRLLNNIGRCYTGLKQNDSAMFYLTKAMRINPENSYIYHNRGALYASLGQFDLACSDLKTAIDKEYNWIIDENLEKVKQAHCPNVNTNRKILIREYKGNKEQLSRYNFIKLNDSLLNEAVSEKMLLALNHKIDNEEKSTHSVFDSFKIYPNPNQGTFFIESELEYPEPLTVKVFDEAGSLVLTQKISNAKKQVSLKDPANGLYVVIISNYDAVLSVKKIIVQN